MQYGRLTLVENLGLLPIGNRQRTHGRFKCACGNEKVMPISWVEHNGVQSCGCLRSELGREHFKQLGDSKAKQPGRREFIAMFCTYRRRAARNGIPFDINLDQFYELTLAPCHYCGAPPKDGVQFLHNGIDRVNSAEGYVSSNTVPCCQFCNRAKMGKPLVEFEEWLETITGDKPYRPSGWVAIESIMGSDGKQVSIEKALQYGWITSKYATADQVRREALEGAPNLFVDQGRQLLAYAFSFRAPIQNFVCQNFGVGTGTRPAKTTDVALQAPVLLASSQYTGPLDSIDFLSAFVVRAAFTLGLADANGSLIMEMGLFSGSNTLIARRVRTVGINKTSDFAPTLTWRLRF